MQRTFSPTSAEKQLKKCSCIKSNAACLVLVVDIIMICQKPHKPASHKQHAEEFNKRPTLCIKDLTRWQIAIAWGTLNPVIVFQSCCPVIYSCCSATVSVLEFLMPHSLSQSRSVMRTWLPECVCVRALVLYVSETASMEAGKSGRGKVKEIGDG